MNSNPIQLPSTESYAPAKQYPAYLRFLLPALLVALLLSGRTREIAASVLSDAFFQVAVFVAGTLVVYHGVRHLSQAYFSQVNGFSGRYQIPMAALLGALPGCGGAIIVITQFIRGQSSFGAMVAVLTSTMGDAAFVLLAAKPADGLLIIVLGIIVGTLSGYIVNAIHGRDYLMPSAEQVITRIRCKPKQKSAQLLWQCLLIPGLLIGFLMAFQINVNQLLGFSEGLIEWIGAGCALSAIVLWSLSLRGDSYEDLVADGKHDAKASWLNDVAHDTNFVLAWVVVAFLIFELIVTFTGIDVGAWFKLAAGFAPFIAILIGLLPGCGPQIIVTTLYIEGHIPFSAQVGNALANDGDALFPAIALAPKAALVATFYSGVPAVIVAYAFYFYR